MYLSHISVFLPLFLPPFPLSKKYKINERMSIKRETHGTDFKHYFQLNILKMKCSYIRLNSICQMMKPV